jgi:hypothetical protein
VSGEPGSWVAPLKAQLVITVGAVLVLVISLATVCSRFRSCAATGFTAGSGARIVQFALKVVF